MILYRLPSLGAQRAPSICLTIFALPKYALPFLAYFVLCCMFLLERDRILKKWYVTVSETQLPTK